MTLRTLGMLAALLVVLAGCGDDDDKADGAGKGDGGSSAGAGASAGKGGDAGSSGASAGSGGASAGSGGSANAGSGGASAGSGGSSAGSGGSSAGNGGANGGSGGATAGTGSSGPTMSGVASSTRLDALSDDDKQKLCDWGAHLPGLGMEKECPDGSTVEASVDTGQECIDSLDVSDCPATVAQYEDCIEAQLADPCEFFVAACDPIFSCLQ